MADAERRLVHAGRALEDAGRRLDRPAARAAAALPLLGRSWRAERHVVDTASAVVTGMHAAVRALPDVRRSGRADLDALAATADRVGDLAAQAEQRLAALEAADTSLTPPRVQNGVTDALESLRVGVDKVRDVADGAAVGAALLGAEGPRTVLVVLGNNAELRGTGGYVSTFALGTLADGTLELGPFQDISDVADPPERARPVPAPADYVEDYGPYLANTTNWRMWTMTPDVPVAAAVGARVAERLTGVRPDVVVFLDVPALAALSALSSRPVALPDGSTVASEQLVEALLVDAYADAGADPAEQEARRRTLRAAAGASAAALLSADFDLSEALDTLGSLAAGRHLALWSAHPEDQRRLVDLSLAGALEPPDGADYDDLCLLSVTNLSANKLDYWVDRSVRHEATVSRDGAKVVQRVRLTDRSPDGLVSYVTGRTTPGRSSLRVEFSVPPAAEVHSLSVDGRPARGDVRMSPDRGRVFAFVPLSRGEQTEIELRYTVPLDDGVYDLRLVPQPLARDADLQVRVLPAEEEPLAVPDGFVRDGGGARRSGPWTREEVVTWRLEEPGRLARLSQALRKFWDEPVSLP